MEEQNRKIFFISAPSASNEKVKEFFKSRGYEIKIMFTVSSLFGEIEEFKPSIIIIDRPHDTSTFKDLMREVTTRESLRMIPKLFLFLREDINSALLEYGAEIDDYLEKPFQNEILLSRVAAVEKWLSKSKGLNEITSLPGENAVRRKLAELNGSDMSFAFLYYHIHDFYPYTLKYGYAAGAKLLRYLSQKIRERYNAESQKNASLIAHLEGKAIVSFALAENTQRIGGAIALTFDTVVNEYYSADDVSRRYFTLQTREGIKKYPLMSMSVLATTNQKRTFFVLEDILKVIEQMKRVEKKERQSICFLDRREDKSSRFANIQIEEEKRELLIKPHALLVSSDSQESRMIGKYLSLHGVNPDYAQSSDNAISKVHTTRYDVIIYDAQNAIKEAYNFLSRFKNVSAFKGIPVIILLSHPEKTEIVESIKRGASRYMLSPVNGPEIHKMIYEVLVSR